MHDQVNAGRSVVEGGSSAEPSPDLLFALSIIDTVREPLLVLNHDLRVHIANRSFYSTFQVLAQETEGRNIFEPGNGQWDLRELRSRLHTVTR